MYLYPIQVAWEITGRCNFKCLYCLNNSGCGSDDPTALKRMDFAKELVANNVLDVIISGGEPLILPEIFEVLELFRSNNVRTTLLTNGTLLSEDKSVRLDGLADIVQISLDSLRPDIQETLAGVKNCYDLILKGIDNALNAGLPLEIGMVLTKLNYMEVGALAEFCISKGIKNMSLLEMMMMGRAAENQKMLKIGPEERRDIYQTLLPYKGRLGISGHEPSVLFLIGNKKEYICDCSHVSCSIAHNGDVLPCSYIREPVGSIKIDSLKDIWNSPTFNRHRELVLKMPEGACGTCKKSDSCRGGCKGLAWSYTGRIDASNPICMYNQLA